ncbi:hypothetical protein EVAR_25248_1 [Eumeta japonica]|uniref:Uncharacterized protein n=1 Tax=Eumeta variegata TaxID=151549 RepID=A0A4C1WHA4_EUMVA|nr:hypothetical protein EVAR_25248_1 [Eumeta japonica]
MTSQRDVRVARRVARAGPLGSFRAHVSAGAHTCYFRYAPLLFIESLQRWDARPHFRRARVRARACIDKFFSTCVDLTLILANAEEKFGDKCQNLKLLNDRTQGIQWQISIAVGRVAPTLLITTAPASAIAIANTSGIPITKIAVEVADAAPWGKRRPPCTRTCCRTTHTLRVVLRTPRPGPTYYCDYLRNSRTSWIDTTANADVAATLIIKVPVGTAP